MPRVDYLLSSFELVIRLQERLSPRSMETLRVPQKKAGFGTFGTQPYKADGVTSASHALGGFPSKTVQIAI
jgi:hypothetical protein